MKREEALAMVKEKVKNKNLIKHMLAVEACMEKLAEEFGEDQEKWKLAGLLHDIDYESTKDRPEEHGFVSAKLLKEKGISEEMINAIKAHSGKKRPENKMEWALYTIDPLTGLIVASALMHPSKSIKELTPDFVLRRFKEKRFAAGADRGQIEKCKQLGLSLERFVALCLEAMQNISAELGL